jgi:hypothetical protein
MKLATQPFTASRAFVGFLLAVTTAAICFTAFTFGEVLFVSGFEASTNHFSVFALIVFVIAWLFAFFTSFIPYWCAIWFAPRPVNTHWLFYVSGAALVSIATSIYQAHEIQLGPALGPIPDITPTLFDAFMQCAPAQVLSGILAGYTCWRFLFRNSAHHVHDA